MADLIQSLVDALLISLRDPKDKEFKDEVKRIRRKYSPRRIFNRWRDSEEGQAWKKIKHRQIQGRCPSCGESLPSIHHFVIDHIKPLDKYPELTIDTENLQLLCFPCNSRKSNKE